MSHEDRAARVLRALEIVLAPEKKPSLNSLPLKIHVGIFQIEYCRWGGSWEMLNRRLEMLERLRLTRRNEPEQIAPLSPTVETGETCTALLRTRQSAAAKTAAAAEAAAAEAALPRTNRRGMSRVARKVASVARKVAIARSSPSTPYAEASSAKRTDRAALEAISERGETDPLPDVDDDDRRRRAQLQLELSEAVAKRGAFFHPGKEPRVRALPLEASASNLICINFEGPGARKLPET